MESGSYIDDKGRTRWHENDRLAEQLKDLADYLIVGGYDESHAARYPRLAYMISRLDEPISVVRRDHRIADLPGVGATIATIIEELMDSGTCTKMEEWASQAPKTVLELTRLPGLGAKTARVLFRDYGIADRAALVAALEGGQLDARLAAQVKRSLGKAV